MDMQLTTSAVARQSRGFTLIELMVALSAGLLISLAAFTMARSATTFFQHEAGITTAQYGAMLGMARLQADLKNASFLGTPNVQVDPKYCGDPATLPVTAGASPGLDNLAGVTLIEDGSVGGANTTVAAQWTANGLAPDAIVIGGAFDTTEQFAAAQVIDAGGGAYNVVLNFVNDGASIRTLQKTQAGGASFSDLFRPGRVLRVSDKEGGFGLGVITNVAENLAASVPNVTITVGANPAMGKREVNSTCGCTLWCVGAPVSVITRMRYDLRSVVGGVYANLNPNTIPPVTAPFHRGPALTAGADRTELIRVEVDSVGNDIAGTLEVLAEYAVDLEFGASFESGLPVGNVPTVTREPVGDPATQRYVVGGLAVAGARPDLMRSIQVRLSTRAPKKDRDVGINPATAPSPSDQHPLRFALGPGLGFARMRTLISDIQLSNQTTRIAP